MYGGFDSLEPPYFFLIALLNIRLLKNLIKKNYSKNLARLNIACYHYSKFIF